MVKYWAAEAVRTYLEVGGAAQTHIRIFVDR
jgi:hypothetical protein